ncbi:7607_t:CDS:2 [Paraglomus occultum]|uniref:7607_t:CDS:1 n=1 Tax=Paraglomus occultum TaxID=144539 RepID=A0A9N8WBQ0_9GLOM|nr:7607_t:CDS:2 [Paraglomus occultum]
MRTFALFVFSFILFIALPINGELVCPVNVPSTTCTQCQAAIDSIFSPNYFTGNGLPGQLHPCDFYGQLEKEIVNRAKPGLSPFDPTVPQLLKDAYDAACSNPSTCTEQEAIAGSKTIETGCGDLVGASNDPGIINATYAYITLRNFIPEKNVFCTKDANGDSFRWQIDRDIINYAATIVSPDIARLVVPADPAIVFFTFNTTGSTPSVHQIPDSVICSQAYKYMVTTFSSFVDQYPLDPRFPYLTENLNIAKSLVQNNCTSATRKSKRRRNNRSFSLNNIVYDQIYGHGL